jgi:hypothetical protein
MNRNGIFLVVVLLLAACVSQQPSVSNSAPSGKWSGDWGPDAVRREPVSVELRWEGSQLTGAVKTGVRSFTLTKASFAPQTGAITLEFDTLGNAGQPVHFVAEGKVEGNVMTGNWSRDDQRGDFRVTREE